MVSKKQQKKFDKYVDETINHISSLLRTFQFNEVQSQILTMVAKRTLKRCICSVCYKPYPEKEISTYPRRPCVIYTDRKMMARYLLQKEGVSLVSICHKCLKPDEVE